MDIFAGVVCAFACSPFVMIIVASFLLERADKQEEELDLS